MLHEFIYNIAKSLHIVTNDTDACFHAAVPILLRITRIVPRNSDMHTVVHIIHEITDSHYLNLN